ncbi:hypothetical protein GCM10010245_43670 [Streptomyces spectabilis]|nr:hypothetical protein GCM10010245_43670 [Streptomyces spectabilis]
METPANSAISSMEAARYPRCPKVRTAASSICRSRTARGIRFCRPRFPPSPALLPVLPVFTAPTPAARPSAPNRPQISVRPTTDTPTYSQVARSRLRL